MHKFDNEILNQAAIKVFESLDELESSIKFLIEKNKSLEGKVETLLRERWELSSELETLKDNVSQFGNYAEKYNNFVNICKDLILKIERLIEFIENLEKEL